MMSEMADEQMSVWEMPPACYRLRHESCPHAAKVSAEASCRSSRNRGGQNSLNNNPQNIASEELAMAECTQGVEVRRTWSETEMVCTFGGQHFPGTPDGMFENWEGELTCVQVVRVPILGGMGTNEVQETLAQTVLSKVVKSQQWLRATHVVPSDFVIFCWLPFQISEAAADQAYDLMSRVQKLDPRFSLRLRVPSRVGDLFPALFAHQTRAYPKLSSSRSLCESDVSTYTGHDCSDDEEERTWDITWAWELEWDGAEASKGGCGAGEDSCDDGGVALAEGCSEAAVAAARKDSDGCEEKGSCDRPLTTGDSTPRPQVRFLFDGGG